MTKEQLHKLITQGEGQQLEFKESIAELDRVIQSLAAFANTNPDGGYVLIGVSDKGKIKEVIIGKDTVKQIADKISTHTDPVLYPKIEVVKESQDKGIIVIIIEGSPNKPHLAFGKAYKRVGSTTTQMTRDEYERLLLAKHESKFQFDSQICEGAAIEDIDEKKVRWFLRKAATERNFEVDTETPLHEALNRLNLIQAGKLTNTAILMFGKSPQEFFIQARIRCARFKGTDGLDFIDMKVMDGTIPQLRESAIKFVMNYIKHAVFFDANQRHDKWEYPLRALEEVLTNSLAHRDYLSNSQIQLSIYDDRIEVWNPGELPQPLIPEDLKKKHKSIPRNKLLADKLFLIKYIEQWGKGTNRVMEEMKQNNLPEPEFQNLSGGFEVTLIGPGRTFEQEIEKQKLHVLEINERQRQSIEYMKKHGEITNREYREMTGLSDEGARKDLNVLIKKGLVQKKGRGRNTYYILK
ncbi:helix-turn-helix domain-containing protein [bacterium]|nr:helix-turn-helix domain-containing protein [bacterium]